MGNAETTALELKDDSPHHRKLKIKQYPSNIPQHEWIPTELLSSLAQNETAEKILDSNGKDRRIRASPPNYHSDLSTNMIHNIVQLKMEYPKAYGFGSGAIIHHNHLSKAYVLTAAHNIITEDKCDIGTLYYPEAIWIELNENTGNEKGHKTINHFNCIGYHIHPNYIKFIKSNKKINYTQTGYDIAIIEVFDPKRELLQNKPFKLRRFKSNIPIHITEVKVIGFPAEFKGELYGMKGFADIRYMNDNIKYNKLIIYDDIDTSPGQSGCPIFECVEEKGNDIYQEYGNIVGVHVGGSKQKGINWGTLINDNILQWIYDYIDVDCVPKDNYCCGSILITSEKSKYASSLNAIHDKMQKTTAINTVKLYYEYTQEIITKQYFLKVMRNIIYNSCFSGKQRFIIYFCGNSDKEGNWMINDDENDAITMKDINKCSYNGIRLYIISDCCCSGNWVQTFKANKENESANGYIAFVQASTKQNESCNPGTFTAKYAECCLQYDSTDGSVVTEFTSGLGMGVGLVTVGVLYDGVFKQPFHKLTKGSQPSSTEDKYDSWLIIGKSYDGKYSIGLFYYNSWYTMDLTSTMNIGGSVGSVGSAGFY